MSDSATSWTVAHQASLSMGFSRQEHWSALPFPPPGDLPNPGIESRSPALQADSLPPELLGKPSGVSHIWGNHGGQHVRSAMHQPRPGKSALVTTVSPRDEDRAVRRLAAPCRLQLLPQHRIGLALGSVRAPPPPGPSAFCFACDAGSSSSACRVSSLVSITTSGGEAEGPRERGPVLLALGLAQACPV